jgi:hypothetical protein
MNEILKPGQLTVSLRQVRQVRVQNQLAEAMRRLSMIMACARSRACRAARLMSPGHPPSLSLR